MHEGREGGERDVVGGFAGGGEGGEEGGVGLGGDVGGGDEEEGFPLWMDGGCQRNTTGI